MSSEDQDWKDLQAAERIVTRLFVNGFDQHAERLVLTSREGKDLGGWCERAAVDIICQEIKSLR